MKQQTMAIGAYLKMLRQLRGLERPEVAEAIGVSARTVANIEEGRANDLRYLQLRRVLECLNGDMADLETLRTFPIPDLASARTLAHRRVQKNSSLQATPRDVTIIQVAGGYLTATLRTLANYPCPWRIRPGIRLYEGISGAEGATVLVNGERVDAAVPWYRSERAGIVSKWSGIGLRTLASVLLNQEFVDAPRAVAGELAHDVLMPVTGSYHWLLAGDVLHEWATLWMLLNRTGCST